MLFSLDKYTCCCVPDLQCIPDTMYAGNTDSCDAYLTLLLSVHTKNCVVIVPADFLEQKLET